MINEKTIEMTQPPTTVPEYCDFCQYLIFNILPEGSLKPFLARCRLALHPSFHHLACPARACSEPDSRLARRKIIYKRCRASDELLHAAGHARHTGRVLCWLSGVVFCCHDRARPRMQAIAGGSNHARRSAVSWRGAGQFPRAKWSAGGLREMPNPRTPQCTAASIQQDSSLCNAAADHLDPACSSSESVLLDLTSLPPPASSA
jgi:hypothetical protein